jgi:putative oxidoreductase
MDVLFLLGRILFAALFLNSGFAHLTKLEGTSQYAASQKVPAPKLAVAVTGLMLITGGLSILLGVAPAIGSLILVAFLLPTAFFMHRFWGLPDAMIAAVQRAHFMKNLSLAGAALIVYYFSTTHPEAWTLSLGR